MISLPLCWRYKLLLMTWSYFLSHYRTLSHKELFKRFKTFKQFKTSMLQTTKFYFTQGRGTVGFRHCTVWIGLESMNDTPVKVFPLRDAEVSPHLTLVSWI